MEERPLLPLPQIQRAIHFIRGHWVMLDADLAEVYGVETRRLNEQVQRNLKRFPPHFLFQLTEAELEILISQIATSRWGGRRKRPYAYTESGAVMAATVLRSPRAVELCGQVVEAFVRLSRAAAVDREILARIAELERRSKLQDAGLQAVFSTIRKLLAPPTKAKARRKVGFTAKNDPPVGPDGHSPKSRRG